LNHLKESKWQKNVLATTTVMRPGEYAWRPSGPHQHCFDCEERRGEERTREERRGQERREEDRRGEERTGEDRRGEERRGEERRGHALFS
jgi:hypothetical protein